MPYNTAKQGLIALALILVAGGAVAESEQPSPSGENHGKPKHYQAKNNSNSSTNESIISCPLPAKVEITNAPQNEEKVDAYAAEKEREASDNNATTLAWVAIVLTTIQAVIFLFTLKASNIAANAANTSAGWTRDLATSGSQSANAAVASAEAAFIAARIMENTAKQELRAYVCVTAVSIVAANKNGTMLIDPETKQHIIIRYGERAVSEVTCVNTGQTPAYNLTIDGTLKMVKWPIDEGQLTIEEIENKSTEIMGTNIPRAKHDILTKNLAGEEIINLIGKDITDLKEGNIALCAYGVIRYEDIFKRPQATYYRYFIGGDIGIKGISMSAHTGGNYVEDTG